MRDHMTIFVIMMIKNTLLEPGAVFTSFNLLCNLQMGKLSLCYITLDWNVLSQTNTLAYLDHY